MESHAVGVSDSGGDVPAVDGLIENEEPTPFSPLRDVVNAAGALPDIERAAEEALRETPAGPADRRRWPRL